MEFTITCPIDGTVEVGLEDIDTVVLRDSQRADMTFVCPHCGTAITVGAIVPEFLLAAMRALADDPSMDTGGLVVVSSPEIGEEAAVIEIDDHNAEAYCEYFRRQLDSVSCVEDMLAEIDARSQ